jgi:ATP-dependent RNA helicase DeaD
MTKFTDLSLSPAMQKALQELGFVNPTEIQEKAIPSLIEKTESDFHGQAQTGTGKTLAFGIPLIERIDPEVKHIQALVIAPTRELVTQIVEALESVAKYKPVTIEAIYGGVPMMNQERKLRKGVQIVVGTTGRVMDHVRRGTLKLNTLTTLVLDEADIMLDMGFKEDIDFILSRAPKKRSIWLFSATVKAGIKEIKAAHMHDVEVVSVSPKAVTTKNTQQFYSIVPSRDRVTAISRFIDCAPDFYGIIFTETKALAAELPQQLAKRGYKVDALHGDMSQVLRNKVISKFKRQEITILVATDVAARGIDVAGLTHVINYSLPRDQESYVHRIGRTGRAGKQGIAISFINRSEIGRLKRLAKKFTSEISQLEVPTFEQVFDVRIKQALSSLESNDEKKVSSDMEKRLRPLIESYSKDALVDGMLQFLSDKFGKFDSHKKDITAPQETSRSYNRDARDSYEIADNMCELMLNVGTMDGVSQEDVLDFIVSSKKIKEKDIAKLRVIKKRSFFTVPANCAKDLLRALDKKKFGGRKTRVSFATSR